MWSFENLVAPPPPIPQPLRAFRFFFFNELLWWMANFFFFFFFHVVHARLLRFVRTCQEWAIIMQHNTVQYSTIQYNGSGVFDRSHASVFRVSSSSPPYMVYMVNPYKTSTGWRVITLRYPRVSAWQSSRCPCLAGSLPLPRPCSSTSTANTPWSSEPPITCLGVGACVCVFLPARVLCVFFAHGISG